MRPSLLIWALLTSFGLLQPSPAGFTVGVLRRDALIVPFATYDGKRWENYWPAPDANADVPLSLHSVPEGWWGPVGPRDTWQAWTAQASPQTVKVSQPDWAPSYCQKQVGLRTNYQPRLRPPAPKTSPYPKDGLAVSPPRPIEAIDVLPPDSPERGGVIEAIHPTFAEKEAAALKMLTSGHLNSPRLYPEAPTQKELLAVPTMTVEALYAFGDARRTYFVEAAREYRKAGACVATGFASGWVLREQGKFAVQSFDYALTACDRSFVNYMLPLGVMSLPTGVYWIAQFSGWDHEMYRIHNISALEKRPFPATRGGGCS